MQSEVQSHCRNKIFVMQSSYLTLGPYFTNAKNQKRQNKKHKKTFINNLLSFSKFSRSLHIRSNNKFIS